MTEGIRAILDSPEMPTDFWLYRLQEVLGLDHPACAACEELRPLVKYFRDRGIKMPITMPAPDLRVSGFNGVGSQLHRIKQGPGPQWDRLSIEDRRSCRRLHRLCDDIRCMIERGNAVTIDDWFDAATGLLPQEGNCASRLELLREGVTALRLAGVEFGYLPAPTNENLFSCLNKIHVTVSDAFGEPSRDGWVRQVHRRIRDLRDALRAEEIK